MVHIRKKDIWYIAKKDKWYIAEKDVWYMRAIVIYGQNSLLSIKRTFGT